MLTNAPQPVTNIPSVSQKMKFKNWPKIQHIFVGSVDGSTLKFCMWCVLLCA